MKRKTFFVFLALSVFAVVFPVGGALAQDEAQDPSVAKDYLGGRGLGIFLLNKEGDPKGHPFSPENPMIMATGPLTGTGAPTGARYMVMTKSPLTGAVTCSNSGGIFPTEFKRSGYDAVVFTGKSNNNHILDGVDLKNQICVTGTAKAI